MAATIGATPVDQPLRIDAPSVEEQTQLNGHRHSSSQPGYDQENGDPVLDLNGELSPNALRRSTRASALKAQEKLKHHDPSGHLRPHSQASNPSLSANSMHDDDGGCSEPFSEDENAPTVRTGDTNGIEAESGSGPTAAKRRRLASGQILNQTDCRFGIRVGDDGAVELMTDESDVSSLDEDELQLVRANYKTMVSKELEAEAKAEKERMVRQLEAEVRLEEAKLMMLKKIRISQQQVPAKPTQEAQLRKAAVGLAQNGTAYRPPVAQPQNRLQANPVKTGANSNAVGRSTSSAQPGNRSALSAATAINNMLPNGRTALQNAALMQQQAAANSRSITSGSGTPSQTPQQKASAAKLALRRQLEQQLLQIAPPRAPPAELHFIPNGNQPDFCYLLGLDLAVQRVLKDKNATRRPNEGPYLCEECGTDFTPVWKAIGRDENSLHLYCEQCVKTAQKRQLRQDHTQLLRKAFAKIAEKEQELEKQILDGKFAEIPALTATPTMTPSSSSTSLRDSAAIASGNDRLAHSASSSNSLAAAHQHKMNAHSVIQREGPAAAHQSSSLQQHKHQAAALAAAAAAKRTSGSLANAAGASSASVAAQNHMQQQMAAAAALRNIPMFAAMMANPLFPGMAAGAGNMANILQMGWNPAVAQRFPNLAMAALAEAAAQTARQQSSAVGGGGGNSNTLNAAMNNAMSSAMSSAFMKQLVQQREQLQRQMLMEMLPKSAGGGGAQGSGHHGGKFK